MPLQPGQGLTGRKGPAAMFSTSSRCRCACSVSPGSNAVNLYDKTASSRALQRWPP